MSYGTIWKLRSIVWALRIGEILDVCHAHLVMISLGCFLIESFIGCVIGSSSALKNPTALFVLTWLVKNLAFFPLLMDMAAMTLDGRLFEIRVLKKDNCVTLIERGSNQIVAWVMQQYGAKQSWTQGFSLYNLFNDFQVLNLIETTVLLIFFRTLLSFVVHSSMWLLLLLNRMWKKTQVG